MKLLLVFIFVFTQALAIAKTGKSKLKDAETDNYLASAKAKDLEDQLSQSEIFLECKENAANNTMEKVEKCIQGKFSEINVDEFADKTNLKSFDLNASKNSTSIRKYLSERLSNALYGEAKKGKMRKLVDHEVYSKLYRSQVGKNILMEVSSYCLVNLGIKGEPNTIVNHCIADKSGAYPKSCSKKYEIPRTSGPLVLTTLAGSAVKVDFDVKEENGKYVRSYSLDKTSNAPFSYNSKTFWKNTYEYELNDACNKKLADDNGNVCVIKVQKSDGTPDYKQVRNSSFINTAKEVEFKLGPEYMRDKYKFCAFSVVKNMCEVYKCRNVYTVESGPEKDAICKDLGVPILAKKPEMAGHKACSLMAKLKQYRKNIATLDVIDDHNKGLRKNTGLSSSMYQGGFYQSGNASGEKSVEEITTISSSELAGKAEIGMSEDEIKELREECIATDGSLAAEEKCQKLVSDLDEDNAKNISADLESETQLYLKKISELDDPESIKEYLIKHGLSKYIPEIENGNTDLLKTLISDEYKSEREALKHSMMEKFNRLTQKNNDPAAPGAPVADNFEQDKNVLAVESIDNIEKQKETIQTLFQYNNVISSYMSATIGEGEDAESTELSYQRDIELEGMTKFGDESTQEKYEEYDKLLNQEDSRASSGNEQMNVDVNFIDSLLGNTEAKKED